MESENLVQTCRDCVSRDFITNRGLVCKRTGSEPAFEAECPDFVYDEKLSAIAPPPDLSNEHYMSREQLLSEENLPKAIVYGLVAALVGAAIWAAISVSTRYQIGIMAIGMGFLVGLAVRKGGKGVRPIFGVVGALLSLLGCFIGDYFSTIGFIAFEYEISFFDMLLSVEVADVMSILIKDLLSMTAVFYIIALYEGYKLSFRVQMPKGGSI